ncbi:MAG: flavodoxin family protein [Desulfobulbaceae bacterium]|nr:flavodoxin family protein [Desulfobulbaceae bacterium]
MKTLVLLGSPRKGGNTEVLLEWVLRGVAKAGGEVELIRLCELEIQPCINCGGCDDTGICIIEDDMTPLYDKILAAQRIIMAAPIYFYGVPAQAKAFVDRTQSLWSRKKLLKKKGVWVEDPERKGFLVSVAATQGKRVFEGAILTMKYTCDAIGIGYGGEFVVRGIDDLGEMNTAVDELAKAEEAGKNFMK